MFTARYGLGPHIIQIKLGLEQVEPSHSTALFKVTSSLHAVRQHAQKRLPHARNCIEPS